MLGIGNIIAALSLAAAVGAGVWGFTAKLSEASLRTKMLEQSIELQAAQGNEAAALADLENCAIAATNIQEALADNAEFADLPDFGELDPSWLRGPKPDDSEDASGSEDDA